MLSLNCSRRIAWWQNSTSGERLQALLQEIVQITSDEARLKGVLAQATAESNRYAQVYGVGQKEAKAKK